MTSPLSLKEPWESSDYSELFEEFHLRAEDLGKILSVEEERSVSCRQGTSQVVGPSRLPPPQAGQRLNQLLNCLKEILVLRVHVTLQGTWC